MALWNWLLTQVRTWKLEEHAEDIAIQALDPVWRLVAHRVATMSLAEARGYIRARAALVLSNEASVLLSRAVHLEAHRSDLLHLASYILVDRLERRVFEAQRQVLP